MRRYLRKGWAAVGAVVVLIGLSALAPATYTHASAPAAVAASRVAASPSSGALSPGNPTITYTAGPFTVPNTSGTATGTPTCGTPATPCDNFNLTVSGAMSATQNVSVTIAWPNPTGQSDFDLYVLDAHGNQVASSATSNDPEVTSFPAASGAYTVQVVPYNPVNESFTGTIKLVDAPVQGSGGGGGGWGTGPVSATVAGRTDPRYQNYVAPNGLGTTAGEPSIGVNWNTGKVLYQSDLQTLQVSFDDSSSPANATWKDVSFATTDKESLDPILFEDSSIGRAFEGQLLGASAAVARTTDDGASYMPAAIGPTNDVDHETIGGGPMSTQVTTLTMGLAPSTRIYYYCTQGIADAGCQASVDNGQSFVETGKMYNISQCGGLHGHIKVAPDGTAYVPNKNCNGTQAVAVSTTDSLTWTVRTVPGSTAGDWDPSVGVGLNTTGLPTGQKSNTVYFGYDDMNHHAKIAVSHDQGQTWSPSIDVGAPFGIQNIAFPAVVAGDDNRAAFAFLGSATPGAGDSNTPSAFSGFWHLYVARTFNGGATWVTSDLTPNDPVQRGPICSQGTTCTVGGSNTRNLLDFIDATVDKQGRLLVGYDDGCIAGCDQGGDAGAQPNSYSDLAVIARQSGGKPLFSANDPNPAEPAVPGRPLVSATRHSATPGQVTVTWPAPDNGGAPIQGYRVYRSSNPTFSPTDSGVTLLTTTTMSSYTDNTTTNYYYEVVAFNTVGDGPPSVPVIPTTITDPNPCVLPGATVATNSIGHQTGAPLNPDLNILSVSVAEPSSLPNLTATGPVTNFLVFTMKLADLSNTTGPNGTLTPGHSWRFLFYPAGTNGFYAGMNAIGGVSGVAPTAQFVFGSLSTVGVASNTPSNPSQTPISGSYSLANNTITVVVATKDVGDPQPGSSLGEQGRSYASLSSTAVLLQATAADFTPIGSYNVVGNAACANGSLVGGGPTATPEPGSGALYATGLAGLLATLGLWRRRKARRPDDRAEEEGL